MNDNEKRKPGYYWAEGPTGDVEPVFVSVTGKVFAISSEILNREILGPAVYDEIDHGKIAVTERKRADAAEAALRKLRRHHRKVCREHQRQCDSWSRQRKELGQDAISYHRSALLSEQWESHGLEVRVEELQAELDKALGAQAPQADALAEENAELREALAETKAALEDLMTGYNRLKAERRPSLVWDIVQGFWGNR